MTTKTLRSGTLPSWRSPVGRAHPERRAQLLDVREVRIAPAECEIRTLRNGDLVATGYASTFDEYEVYGGPENYGWIERIDRKAFNKTMKDKPDVVYLVNHAGLPLARTKSGTLSLKVDDGGLGVEALLEKTDPDVLALQPKMARGDVDEMSFAFYVKMQDWSAADGYEDDPYSYRLITEVSLHRGDVSVVTFGANPHTSAALGIVGGADADSMPTGDQHLRDVDPETVRQVMATVERGLMRGAVLTMEWNGENDEPQRHRIEVTRSTQEPVVSGGGGAGGDNAPDTTTGEQGTSIADARNVLTDNAGVPATAVKVVPLPDGETISLADAKAAAGVDLSVAAARADTAKPAADTPPGTLSLADARKQV